MRTTHWKSAAIAIASSMEAQTSVIRISSVGKCADGRMSHQIIDASSSSPALTRMSTCRLYSLQESKRDGSPVRGNSSKTLNRYDFKPESSPRQNGDEVESI